MLIRLAIQRVQSLYSKGVQSRSSRLSNRNIYYKFVSTRSTLHTNEKKKKFKISQWTYQTLPCIELISVPLNECPCTLQSGCIMLRSKYPIPSIMTEANKHIIQSVTGLEGKMALTEINYEDIKYQKGNKYTSKDPSFFFRTIGTQVFIYITVTTRIPCISLVALFDDPIEAYLFPSFCNPNIYECLNYLDFEFPIDDDQMNALIQITATELIDAFTLRKQDESNNNIDDINAEANGRRG